MIDVDIHRRPVLKQYSDTVYSYVICDGHRRGRSDRTCNTILGQVNLSHPHDVRYVCRNCGTAYELRKE